MMNSLNSKGAMALCRSIFLLLSTIFHVHQKGVYIK